MQQKVWCVLSALALEELPACTSLGLVSLTHSSYLGKTLEKRKKIKQKHKKPKPNK